ncbi:hypothetical protein [Flavobacterium gyeonganense]|uniref:Uncharacterized protein n=1 Tax=Flavobacterium gyeonganense TaxID=1310418 RepID=A0ABV5HET1_9FLAO|nr:hypothetical protein [Flavobacterium gyeonganense]
MVNFTFFKILINIKNRKFNIFLVCFLLLVWANKSYAKAYLFLSPVHGFQVTSSSGNLFFSQANKVNLIRNNETVFSVREEIAKASHTQNPFFIQLL